MTAEVDHPATRDIVELVLVVARLGEADQRGWWQSRALGSAGRVVLKSRLPRTWRAAALEIDVESARRRHNEIIDRPNAVHLFSDVWPVGRWVRAWLSESKTLPAEPERLRILEAASVDDLLEELQTSGSSVASASKKGRGLLVGRIPRHDLDNPESTIPYVRQLAHVYTTVTSEFLVPYLEVDG